MRIDVRESIMEPISQGTNRWMAKMSASATSAFCPPESCCMRNICEEPEKDTTMDTPLNEEEEEEEEEELVGSSASSSSEVRSG